MNSNKNIQQEEKHFDKDSKQICSFFLNGTCTRGKNCRFSHEPSVSKRKSSASGGRVEGERFHPSAQLVVNDTPKKDIFEEFMQHQLEELMGIIKTYYPDLLKGMDNMQDLLFAFFNKQTTAELFLKKLNTLLEHTQSLLGMKEKVMKHLAPLIEINAADAADADDEEAAADDDEEAAAADIKYLFNTILVYLTRVTMELFDFLSDPVLAIFKEYATKSGSFEKLFYQLSEFQKILINFVKVTTESWDGLNRASIMHPPQNQVQAVIGRYTSINAIQSVLSERLMHLDSRDPEENKQKNAIESMLRLIISLKSSSFPIGIICPPALIDAIAMILEGTTEYVKEVKKYQETLAMETQAIELLHFDTSSIISKASSGDASIKSILSTIALMFGKHRGPFESFKEKHPSIEVRIVEFFKLLQSKLLKMIHKKDQSDFLESIASDITDDKMFNATLEKLYMELFTAFEEDVILAEKEMLEILQHIKKHSNVFGPLLDFLLSPISRSGEGPLHFKSVDFFLKNNRTIFEKKLTMDVSATDIVFNLKHGCEPECDVTRHLVHFCMKMAVLNSMLVGEGKNPFLGNFKANPILDDQDSNTIALAVLSAVEQMTGNPVEQSMLTMNGIGNSALSSRNMIRYHEYINTPSSKRVDALSIENRFCIFLNLIVDKCFVQRHPTFSMDAVNEKTGVLFESIYAKQEHRSALFAIMTSALKLSSTPLKTMHQCICLTSEGNQELSRRLLSFVISPAPESEQDCTGLSYHRDIVETINQTYNQKPDVPTTKKIVFEFYRNLSYLMHFVLSNLGPIDVSMVNLLYKKLESFNADQGRRHSFPYMTQFMCAVLIAMQNYGYSLGDALKRISIALTNGKYRTFNKNESKSMFEMHSRSASTGPVDFKKNKAFNHNPADPHFIQILLSDLKSSSDRKCQELEAALDALYLCLASDELTKKSTLTLPNMLYSILMGILSQSPKDFFKVYGIDFSTPASLQVGPVDLSIEAKILSLLGPLLKADVSTAIMEVFGALREKDKESARAAALLTVQDRSDRFHDSKNQVILDTFRGIIYGMGLLSRSELSDCESPNAILARLKVKKSSFLKLDMFQMLLFKIRSYTRKDEEQTKQNASDAAMRKQRWEERCRQMYSDVEQQDGAGAEMAVSICQEVPVPVPVPASSAELCSDLDPETQELFNMCPPLLLCVDMLVKILTAISEMKVDVARNRCFENFLAEFECIFNTKTISLAFDDVDDFTALTPKLLSMLSTKFESSYSSKEAYAESLGIEEFTPEMIAYIDAVVREFDAHIHGFIKLNQQCFTVVFC